MCRLACKASECCCCFKRDTGGKFIGFFYIIIFFFGIIGPIIELHKHRNDPLNLDNSKENATEPATMSESMTIFEIIDVQQRRGHADFENAMALLIIVLLCGILINMLMVWGIYLKFCWFLLPWLIFQLLVAAIHLMAPVIAIYKTNYGNFGLTYSSQKYKVLFSLVPIFLGVLGLYFWTIIRQLFDDYDDAGKVKDEGGKKTEGGGASTLNVVLAVQESPNKSIMTQPSVVEASAPPKVID